MPKQASSPLSLRLGTELREQLVRRAESSGLSTHAYTQRLVAEGLVQEAHPSIRFAQGPSGRRATLVGTGLDVWEVIAVVKENGGDHGAAAEYLRVAPGLVQAAVSYYADMQNEIDRQIGANAQLSRESEERWRKAQGLFS